MKQSGFEVEKLKTRDLHPGRKLSIRSQIFRALKPARFHEEGLFVLATKRYGPQFARPIWLYVLADRMHLPEYVQKQIETPVALSPGSAELQSKCGASSLLSAV